MVTTGFNYKPIDMIAHLRPTASTGLWVQSLGRGTRPHFSKKYCLVLDFAGNARRLGPINDPVIPKKRSKSKSFVVGVPPVKICPNCNFYNATRAAACIHCLYAFPHTIAVSATAGTDELIRTSQPVVTVCTVTYMMYDQRTFKNGKPHLSASYYCGPQALQRFVDRVWLENEGASRSYAMDWWKKRYCGDGSVPARPQFFTNYVPTTVSEALQLTKFLRAPKTIRVRVDKAEPEIIGYDF